MVIYRNNCDTMLLSADTKEAIELKQLKDMNNDLKGKIN